MQRGSSLSGKLNGVIFSSKQEKTDQAQSCSIYITLPWRLRRRPHYDWIIWKRNFHSENPSIHRPVWICIWSQVIIATTSHRFWKSPLIFKMLSEHKKPAFSNFFSLKSAFGKRQFLDGLVWTISLKAAFTKLFDVYFSLRVGSHALFQEQGGSRERRVCN